MASLQVAPCIQFPSPAPERWLSRTEFCKLADWSSTWLAVKVRDGAVRTRTTNRTLRNGRPETEYAASSLPAKALATLQTRQEEPEQRLSLFTPHLLPATAPRIATDPTSQHSMTEKLNLIQPLLQYEDDPRRYTALKLCDGRHVHSKSDLVQYISETSGQSVPTLWRYLKRYKSAGEGGLLKSVRSDAGQSDFFTKHRDAAALVASLYLGDGFLPGASVQQCHRALAEQCGLLGLAVADLPSYGTVRRFLQSAPEPLKVLARLGKKKFGESCMPYVTRGYTEHANEIWISDHCIADVEVLNDCFTDLPYGEPMRMRLTALLDYRSRYLVGHTWCVEGSSVSLGATMAQAIRRHGPCELFYCDNGKDYQKIAKGAVPGYLQRTDREAWWAQELDSNAGMLARCGIRVNFCLPHHPQSKHVERFFRTMHSQFCSSWWTYTAGQPQLRPDTTAALMMVHRRLLKRGEVERSMHPTATMVMQVFEAWLDGYHAAPHSGQGMDGRSPAEVFQGERNPNQPPAPPNELLLLAAMEHDTRVVRETAVHLFDTRYLPADDAASARLFALNGREVHIAYDRLDPEWIAVLDQHGHVLCMLRVEQRLRMAPDDAETQAQIAASMQQRGMLARQTREALQAITRERKRIGAKAPVELLAAKALPAAVDADRVTQRAVKPQRLRQMADANAAKAQPQHAAGIARNFLKTLQEAD